MSDIDKQDLKQEAVPFFARYLEGQINFIEEISEEETQAVAGGTGVKKLPLKAVTEKFPSDQEDGGGVVTLKFPCGQEDGGGVVTLKFPSDQEDVAGGGIMTKKYPSDSDECAVK
jgi:hypothetical protein